MSGETRSAVSGWTVDTLKEHMDRQFDGNEKALKVALDSLNKRLDGMNEFRGALADQAQRMMPRTESDQRFNTLRDTVAKIENWQATVQGAQTHESRSDSREDNSKRTMIAIIAILVPVAILIIGGVITIVSRLPTAP